MKIENVYFLVYHASTGFRSCWFYFLILIVLTVFTAAVFPTTKENCSTELQKDYKIVETK